MALRKLPQSESKPWKRALQTPRTITQKRYKRVSAVALGSNVATCYDVRRCSTGAAWAVLLGAGIALQRAVFCSLAERSELQGVQSYCNMAVVLLLCRCNLDASARPLFACDFVRTWRGALIYESEFG